MASLSESGAVDTSTYESYDGGDRSNSAHDPNRATAWHRRIAPETWLWFIIVGAIAALWAIGGGFRKVLS